MPKKGYLNKTDLNYGRLWTPRPPFFIRFLGPRGCKYVSSCSGCICHEYLNFIQSGCGHCVVRFLGILRRGGGGGMLSQLIDFVNDCFIPRISTGYFIFSYTKLNFIFTNFKIERSWILLDPFSTNSLRKLDDLKLSRSTILKLHISKTTYFDDLLS